MYCAGGKVYGICQRPPSRVGDLPEHRDVASAEMVRFRGVRGTAGKECPTPDWPYGRVKDLCTLPNFPRGNISSQNGRCTISSIAVLRDDRRMLRPDAARRFHRKFSFTCSSTININKRGGLSRVAQLSHHDGHWCCFSPTSAQRRRGRRRLVGRGPKRLGCWCVTCGRMAAGAVVNGATG